MLDDAALALEEIEPEEQGTNRGSWSTYCSLHHGEEMGHWLQWLLATWLKVEPQNEAWWINLAYSLRRSEGISRKIISDLVLVAETEG